MIKRLPLMSHADRQALIRRPFPRVRYVERATWAGVLIHSPEDVLKGLVHQEPAPCGRRIGPERGLDYYDNKRRWGSQRNSYGLGRDTRSDL